MRSRSSELNLRAEPEPPATQSTGRPWFSGLMLGAVLLPALLIGTVAWQDRVRVLQHAQRDIEDDALIFAGHADNVFETHKLIADLVNERIDGMGWEDIGRSHALHSYLSGIVSRQPRIMSIWLADPSGVVRNSSAIFPVSEFNVADRDYFVALRQRDVGTFIGKVVHNPIFAEDIFNVAQRRSTEGGAFDGVVIISALPSYLTNFWAAATHEAGNAILFRQDGAILARFRPVRPSTPPLRSDQLPLKAVRDGKDVYSYRDTTSSNGADGLFAYRKVNEFPVYAGRGISLSVALQKWYDDLVFLGIIFVIGTAALVTLALIASRRLQQYYATAIALRHEIDHRESVEAQFWEAQKMQALGRLAGESAHDFGNILSVISGSLDALEGKPNDGKALALARSAATRGVNLVGAMLSFARRKPPHQELFDLNVAVSGMEGLLRQALGPRIDLSIVTAMTPCWIAVDRNQLEQAILNITVNARDAMPDGGSLAVMTSVLHLRDDLDGLGGDYVALAIRDTGVGIRPDVRARIFEPFFTTKASGKGSGLGLSMVYGFCQQWGGSVSVESAMAQGTTMVIRLPLHQVGDRPADMASESVAT